MRLHSPGLILAPYTSLLDTSWKNILHHSAGLLSYNVSSLYNRLFNLSANMQNSLPSPLLIQHIYSNWPPWKSHFWQSLPLLLFNRNQIIAPAVIFNFTLALCLTSTNPCFHLPKHFTPSSHSSFSHVPSCNAIWPFWASQFIWLYFYLFCTVANCKILLIFFPCIN